VGGIVSAEGNCISGIVRLGSATSEFVLVYTTL
jgi:hypothetical protein